MVKTMAEALMGAPADAVCGAEYGRRSGERVSRRNGYREREREWEWGTHAGTVELSIPKLRFGSYFPEWLLERRRAEQVLVSVVATPVTAGVEPVTARAEPLPTEEEPLAARADR